MEKVKLTKAQAEAVEYFDRVFVKNKETSMSNKTLFKALRHGYEVEPEFKENDWLNYLTIHGDLITDKVIDVSDDRVLMELSNSWVHFDNVKSHATPEEIKQEKERRFWKGNDRDVWELRNGDVLICDGHPRVVDRIANFNEKSVLFNDNDWEYFENVVEEYKVLAFNKDRLDVKTND